MFCLKSLQLLLQRSNRLNCFEQCPCGTCQRHQGQDDVHDTGTHWPKDRQQVRYPWRKISGHWPNSMASHRLTLAWMIMKYHECTYALWTLQCVAISQFSPGVRRVREILQIRSPSNTLETLWNLPNKNLQRQKPKSQIPRLEGKKTPRERSPQPKPSIFYQSLEVHIRQSNSESPRKFKISWILAEAQHGEQCIVQVGGIHRLCQKTALP